MQIERVDASFSEEVRHALSRRKGIVALESTLVAHGLPWPVNLETALAMEEAVREAGALPATIALLNGRPWVGLSRQLLERMARHPDGFQKAGARDLPILMAERANAATTVGSTLFIAYRSGIRVLATGGIGGVHRGAAETSDISSDLIELSRTPLVVVCSGAKSILDLPRTMELLETLSIPVVGFRTDELPAFHSRRSGLALDHRVEEPGQVAEIFSTARRLRLPAGLLVANPVPAESALELEEIQGWIAEALRRADRAGVFGKAVTPFLLESVRDLSEGRSVVANQALAVSNARLAASIAAAIRTEDASDG